MTDTFTSIQGSAFEELRGVLADWGLEELADWAWGKIVNDQISTTAALVQIRDQKPWIDRFGTAVNGLIGRGLPAMTEAQIMAYEKGYRETARRYGLPTQFYDSHVTIQGRIAAGQSFENAVNDIEEGFARVARTSPQTRAVFAAWFGVESDAAIASLFINPDLGREAVVKAAKAAELAGVGSRRVGLVDQARATQLVDAGVSVAAARSGFERIDRRRAAFSESISETDDLVAAAQGVDAEFGIGEGGRAVDRRLEQRSAANRGGGGATRGRRGIGGLEG